MNGSNTFIFTLSFAVISSFLVNCSEIEPSIGIQDLNEALTRLLNFLDEHHRFINVDCVFGLRVVEGQLMSIEQRYSEGKLPHVHNTVIHALNKLQQKAAQITSEAFRYTMSREPTYAKSFLRIIDSPFHSNLHHSREVQFGHVANVDSNLDDNFQEKQSDKCVSDLLGSQITEPCSVSSDCWQFVSKVNPSGYTATHQILFFLIAEKIHCMDKLEEKELESDLSIEKLYETVCSSIYHEAKQLANTKPFPDDDKDLFMEQIAICAHAGFSQFLQPDWLELVLSWQSESGCYGTNDDEEEDESSEEDDRINEMIEIDLKKETSNLDIHINDGNVIEEFNNEDIRRGVKPVDDVAYKFTARKLLREQVLPNTGGCLSHMSGIAAACLSVFYNHFLSPEQYTKQLFDKDTVGVDMQGRVIYVNPNNRLTNQMKKDVKSKELSNVLPLQSIFILFVSIFLMLFLVRSLKRGGFKSFLKRYL